MCGITGWFGWELPRTEGQAKLEAMCEAIRHRGPDDSGFFLDDHAALAMRRLSILDLAGGRQPMTSDDGNAVLVFNGEIFNHAELRQDLTRAGERFVSRSDTEVILRLFLRHGEAGLHRLNGMFAIAIWDARERSLFLMRDRMGVKPLYYAWDGRRLLFASEIKSILAAKAFDPEVDDRAIWDYLTFRYVPGPRTIWKQVRSLPPGHVLTISRGEPEPAVRRYWDIPYGEISPARDDAASLEEFSALLGDAVSLRMLADVPVGITLSGGLDSSVVAALAAREHDRVKTFTVAFENAPGADERSHARQVAAALGCEHHEVVIGPGDFTAFLPDMVWHADQPLADMASVPLFHVCKLARESVKVVLSGEGSDEILAGYNLETWARRWDAPSPPRRLARALLGLVPDALLPRRARFVKHEMDQRRWPAPLHISADMTSQEKRRLLRHGLSHPDSQDLLRQTLERLGPVHPLHQTLYLYCQDWLVEDLLMKADRMSMAVSLELRTPFLDYRLVEWAARAAPSLKAGLDARGRWRSKRVLRELGRTLLPEAIVERPKQGFPVPVYGWLDRELRPLVQDLLLSGRPRLGAWCREDAVAELVAHALASPDHARSRHRVMQLLVLEIWCRRWL